MREVIYKNQDYQLLFNNNNEIEHSGKICGSLNQKQSLNNEKLFSLRKKQMRKIDENDYNTIVQRVNEHSYIVSLDKRQQETKFHSGKSTLIDIHTQLLHNKENLLTNQGFIHIKEYIIDNYQCRCHEYNHLINNQDINKNKNLFNHKLEF